MAEEINRVATDHVASLHFAPTVAAAENLAREGFSPATIHIVGDVMYDAHLQSRAHAARSEFLSRANVTPGKYILATIHRAENTRNPQAMTEIADAFIRLSKEMPVVFPVHPGTREVLSELGLIEPLGNAIQLIDALNYFDMLAAEENAALIITDSGGVQKEAFFYSVPCITLRDETEWVELLHLGWNHLMPPALGGAAIAKMALANVGRKGRSAAPYGYGDASAHIVEILAKQAK
jgi:UDP-GlcNAc3NAcA epimerase